MIVNNFYHQKDKYNFKCFQCKNLKPSLGPGASHPIEYENVLITMPFCIECYEEVIVGNLQIWFESKKEENEFIQFVQRIKEDRPLRVQLEEKITEFTLKKVSFEEVLKIAKKIEPYEQEYCYPDIKMNCGGSGGKVGKSWEYCGGCWGDSVGPADWRDFGNLLNNQKINTLDYEQIRQIDCAINNKKYYPPKPPKKKYYKTRKCKFSQCENILYLKTNKQYCSYACSDNYRNSDEYKQMVKNNMEEDIRLWKLIKEKNFTEKEIEDYTGLATMRRLYNLKFGPEEILQYREKKDQFWQEIYDKEDRQHKYYMKYEHQFKNYEEAKKWYEESKEGI